METSGLPKPDNVMFGEIQVLLAEKRTALASLRTGIAVFALPLSVLSALIATSRYYSIEKVMPLLAPLMLLNLGLVVLGTWLVFRSIHRIRHFEHRIRDLSEKYRSVAQFIEWRSRHDCHYRRPARFYEKPLTMRPSPFKIFGDGAEVRGCTGVTSRHPMSEVSDQLLAAALARARSSQAVRKAFISARSATIRLATPLYFFVIPVTVRVTAPWWTRP